MITTRLGCNEDCSGVADDPQPPSTWFADNDGDGVGDVQSSITASCPPDGQWVDAGADCDDTDAAVLPGAPELCNGVDDDCDALLDEGCDSTDPLGNDDTDATFAADPAAAAASEGGCACSTSGAASFPTPLLALGLLLRRRSRARRAV